eukprot:TRINITY_DN3875_c0_g1_i1.p1 TRINITY_DN3875_c0_g1~~TRINITY_DN3875_c0_g1_i1.p1  ORF type:complete len:1544 (+),score=476.19 TRINITY_DN3875_c0_g1_i1:46-4632(+)
MALRPKRARFDAGPPERSRVVERSFVPKRISEIAFSTFGSHEIRRLSHLCVLDAAEKEDDLHDEDIRQRLYDRRLGICSKGGVCGTCGLDVFDCQGHFGHAELAAPVFHNGFLKHVVHILRCICKGCCRVLLQPADRVRQLKLMRHPQLTTARRQRVFSDLVATCQKALKCPTCGFINGRVKREMSAIGPRLVHERYGDAVRSRARQQHLSERERLEDELEFAMAANDDALRPLLADGKRICDDLNPAVVRELLDRIPLEDREILDLGRHTSPANLVCSTVLVPPVIIRPSVDRMGGSERTDDDVTHCIKEAISASLQLSAKMKSGEQPSTIMRHWEMLQLQYASLLDSDKPGYKTDKTNRRCFAQRLKGKLGRFRRHLSGKRADYSGRTVISPDPNIAITEVAIPIDVARILTYPERVFKSNIKRLKEAVIAGSTYPGAGRVKLAGGDWRELSFLAPPERKRIADSLAAGDVVERHMINGDRVVFNRQPSLHRVSMMCHRARVLPYRTFRFNECCCAPYNADFDGDEMNIFLPQTEEARAECAALMGTSKNIISVRHGEPIIAATQDFLTGAYLLTRKSTFFNRSQASQALAHMHEDGVLFTLPPPAILKPVELWTGKQIMSLLVRPNPRIPVVLNFETRNKSWNPQTVDPFDCEKDGYVIFRNSEHLSGVLDKMILGGGSKHGLFYQLFLSSGSSYCARCMSRLSRLTTRWLSEFGFSIGLNDVTPPPGLRRWKEKMVNDGTSDCSTLLRKFNAGNLEAEPGHSMEATLEMQMNARLAKVRTECGGMAMNELHRDNAAVVMSVCGSKGSAVNVSQMAATLGQVTVFGKRIANGFIQRALPHFERHSRLPPARGFVKNSFFTGLAPHEFFFHTMGGREGLVDTVVKTADTGYMQRRLVKSMEDLCVQYNNRVTDSTGAVLQLRYGDDGVDPLYTETTDYRPVNLDVLWARIAGEHREVASRVGSVTPEMVQAAEAALADAGFRVQAESIGRSLAEILGRAADLHSKGSHEEANRIRWNAAVLVVGTPLSPDEVVPFLDKRLQEDPRFQVFKATERGRGPAFSALFVEELRTFCSSKARELRELVDALTKRFEEQSAATGQASIPSLAKWMHTQQSRRRGLRNAFTTACGVICVTRAAIDNLLEECVAKHQQKAIEPGSTCGAMAAQSICEPATQMTLRTFHFAGQAVSITQGVPRLKEVVNAAKTIKTPITTAYLNNESDARVAKVIRARVQPTRLKDIMSFIEERYAPEGVMLVIRLDMGAIERRSLDGITAETVKQAILDHTVTMRRKRNQMPLTARHIVRQGDDTLCIHPYDSDNRETLLHTLQHIKMQVPEVVVAGLHCVRRAVVKEYKQVDKQPRYLLLIEGKGDAQDELLQIMKVPGIETKRTGHNHIWIIERTLGIEAARSLIIDEIVAVMKAYDARIDIRHIMHLADVMTFRGTVLGITRQGMQNMWDSVMTLASFEKTTEVLYDAAVHRRTDKQRSVSQQIIFGAPIRAGTGLFKLLRKVEREAPETRRKLTPLFLRR